MNYSFELDDIINNVTNAIKSKATRLKDYADALRSQLIADQTDIEKKLDDYDEACGHRDYFRHEYFDFCGKVNSKIIDKIKDGYKLFDKMARNLSLNCNAEIVDDKIIVGSYGTLSLTAELLSKHYGFHCGTFAFNSGFTSHLAYSDEMNYEFRIGLNEDANRKRDGRICIDFNLMHYLDKDFEVR